MLKSKESIKFYIELIMNDKLTDDNYVPIRKNKGSFFLRNRISIFDSNDNNDITLDDFGEIIKILINNNAKTKK